MLDSKSHKGHDCFGVISGEQISLVYSGVAFTNGQPVAGTITLRLKVVDAPDSLREGRTLSGRGFEFERSDRPAGIIPQANDRVGSEQPQFIPLFNGKDLTGWREGSDNKGSWEVRDGILYGRGAGGFGKGPGTLNTERTDFRNFHLRLITKNLDMLSKEVLIRWSDVNGRGNGYGISVGDTITTDNRKYSCASIFKSVNKIPRSIIRWDKVASSVEVKSGEFYAIDVVAVDNQITTSINGKEVAQLVDVEGGNKIGNIRLVCSSVAKSAFKEILIRELKEQSDTGGGTRNP